MFSIYIVMETLDTYRFCKEWRFETNKFYAMLHDFSDIFTLIIMLSFLIFSIPADIILAPFELIYFLYRKLGD